MIDGLGVLIFFLGLLLYLVIVPRLLGPESYMRSSWVFFVVLDLYLSIRLFGFVRTTDDRRWRRVYVWLLAAALLWLASDCRGMAISTGMIADDWLGPIFDPILYCGFLVVLIAARSRELPWDRDDAGPGAARPTGRLGPLVFYATMFPLMHFGIAKTELFNPSLASIRETLVLIFLVLLSSLAYLFQRMLETENRILEQQLSRTQTMESLGTFASGIAHDFNNILQAISGYNSLALATLKDDQKQLQSFLQKIGSGAQRASDLVDQILTFSRSSHATRVPLRLQDVTSEAIRFLQNTIPETIETKLNFDQNCKNVNANDTQIFQMVTNLCTNAIHAMEGKDRGVLAVTIEPLSIGSLLETLMGTIASGDYVQISVTDNGTGIDPDQIHRVLDPFYTTKDPGKGTGLGLAMAHGISTSMGGGIVIESELGVGTTVRVILPVIEGASSVHEPPLQHSTSGNGSGHLLLVDDEKALTDLFSQLLVDRGFTVDSFNNADSALAAFETNSKDYEVAILDYAMPGMTGIELARKLESLIPGLPVILTTGMMDETKIEQEKTPNIVEITKKPFNLERLVSSINQTLR